MVYCRYPVKRHQGSLLALLQIHKGLEPDKLQPPFTIRLPLWLSRFRVTRLRAAFLWSFIAIWASLSAHPVRCFDVFFENRRKGRGEGGEGFSSLDFLDLFRLDSRGLENARLGADARRNEAVPVS